MSKFQKTVDRKTGGGISVEEFGADGTGTINETTALQQALDTVQHVYLPAGTYLVNGTVTASMDGQIIEGAGKGTVIKMMASKTYDLTQQHAALTMNAGNQTVQDLQLIGPDTGDDSTFSGSGSDWYNLSALRVNGEMSTVNGVQIDRCEGVGMTIAGIKCEVSLCHIERAGLGGLRSTQYHQSVTSVHFDNCQQYAYNSITTYPSNTSFAAHFHQYDAIISNCVFRNNVKAIRCERNNNAICNNICRSGVHVAGPGAVVSNNYIYDQKNNNNALTVANDGNAYIATLVGNNLQPMNQGGTDDIIDRGSYSIQPVKQATANNNPDIDRVYQRRAYSQIEPNDHTTDSNGRVRFQNVDDQQVIRADNGDYFIVPRPARVQMTIPPVYVNNTFTKGRFVLKDSNNDITVNQVFTQVGNESSSSYYFLLPCTMQVSLQPNIYYHLHLFSDGSETNAEAVFENGWKITIIDLE
jgi:hypothetical protein